MSRKIDSAMEAAVLAMLASNYIDPKPKVPEVDKKRDWDTLNQEYRRSLEDLQKAQFAETAARDLKLAKAKITKEIRAQIELLAIDLNIDTDQEALG